jgi:hypothetical protein
LKTFFVVRGTQFPTVNEGKRYSLALPEIEVGEI